MPHMQHHWDRSLVLIGRRRKGRGLVLGALAGYLPHKPGSAAGFGLSLVLLPGTTNSRGPPNIRSRIWSYVYILRITCDNAILEPAREFRLSGNRVSPRQNRPTAAPNPESAI